MFKKIFAMMLVVLSMLTVFIGCSKVVDVEEYESTVTIVDVNYTPVKIFPVQVGKTTIMQTTPADYDVIVEYAGVEYEIDSLSAYNIAKDKVGKVVMGKIEKTRYEDGKVKFSVTGLVKED